MRLDPVLNMVKIAAISVGWTGAARLVGGGEGFRVGVDINVEEQQDNVIVGARVSLSASF